MSTADRIINYAQTAADEYGKRLGLDSAARLQYQIGLLQKDIVTVCAELAWAKRELRMARPAEDPTPDASDFESMCRATAQAARVAA